MVGLIVSLILSVLGCGLKEDDSADYTMVSSYKKITNDISKLDELSPTAGTSSTSFNWDFSIFSKLYATAFGDNWTLTSNVGLRDPESDSEGGGAPVISIKEYLGKQFNSELTRPNGSAINAFGRIKSALGIFCAVGSLLETDADGYPSNGDHPITFTLAVLEDLEDDDGCDISFEKNEAGDYTMQDQTITLNVTNTTDTTVYDKKLTVDMGTGGDMIFYMRYNESEINIVSAERNGSGDNEDHEYRTIIQHDLDGDLLRAEYISVPAASSNTYVYFYRVYMTSDEAYVIAFKGAESGSDNLMYAGAGTIEDSSTTSAISFTVSAEQNGVDGGSAFENLNACIDRTTGDIDTDDSLSCGTSLDSASQQASFVSELVDSFIESKNEAGWITEPTVSEANDNLNFDTVAEMFSEAPNKP